MRAAKCSGGTSWPWVRVKVKEGKLESCNQKQERLIIAKVVRGGGPTHSRLVSPSWIGARGPQRGLLGSEQDSSGEPAPLWRSPTVLGSMGFSIDDAQLSSFSCSSPPNSSSSSKSGLRWSLAHGPSAAGSGSTSSSRRPRTSGGKRGSSCQVTGPKKSECVCVHLSAVDGTELASTCRPFTLVTMFQCEKRETFTKMDLEKAAPPFLSAKYLVPWLEVPSPAELEQSLRPLAPPSGQHTLLSARAEPGFTVRVSNNTISL